MLIITNNVPRPTIDALELTLEERAEFDYFDWEAIDRGEDCATFFRYKGELHDLGEFMVWDNPMSPTRAGWHGFRSDSYFSGLAVRYVGEEFGYDMGYVVVARVMS